MAEGGFTPREIDRFTLGEINSLFDYWTRVPSIRAMIAGFLGVKSKPKPGEKLSNTVGPPGLDVDALLREFPDGIIR